MDVLIRYGVMSMIVAYLILHRAAAVFDHMYHFLVGQKFKNPEDTRLIESVKSKFKISKAYWMRCPLQLPDYKNAVGGRLHSP